MCLGVPGVIESVSGEELERMAKVSVGGTVIDANIGYLPEAKVGDFILVHVGFGLSIIDEEEAIKTLEMLKEIGEIEQQLDEAKNSGSSEA